MWVRTLLSLWVLLLALCFATASSAGPTRRHNNSKGLTQARRARDEKTRRRATSGEDELYDSGPTSKASSKRGKGSADSKKGGKKHASKTQVTSKKSSKKSHSKHRNGSRSSDDKDEKSPQHPTPPPSTVSPTIAPTCIECDDLNFAFLTSNEKEGAEHSSGSNSRSRSSMQWRGLCTCAAMLASFSLFLGRMW